MDEQKKLPDILRLHLCPEVDPTLWSDSISLQLNVDQFGGQANESKWYIDIHSPNFEHAGSRYEQKLAAIQEWNRFIRGGER